MEANFEILFATHFVPLIIHGSGTFQLGTLPELGLLIKAQPDLILVTGRGRGARIASGLRFELILSDDERQTIRVLD